MLTFSPAIQGVLSGDVTDAFYLLKLGGKYSTSHYTNVTYDQTYIADGSIIDVEPPKMTSIVDRQSFKITLSDTGNTFGVFAENGMVGVDISVRIGFVNPATGKPFTNLVDTMLIYEGIVDAPSYQISMKSIGDKLFVLACASPINDLDLVRAVYTSQDYLNKHHPGDTSYEQIYDGAGPINLRWGK